MILEQYLLVTNCSTLIVVTTTIQATTGTDSEDRMIIFSEEDNAWFNVFSFLDPDYTSNNNNEALGSTGVNVFA